MAFLKQFGIPRSVPAGAFDSHVADADIHRTINDSGTGAEDLWSASKIDSELTTLGTLYNRRGKVIDYVDNTAAPPTEISGDRYLLDFTGGTVHADWDGASKGDIVQFNGTTWDATTPSEGWRLYVDNENQDRLYVDDPSPDWEPRPAAINDHNALTDLQGGTSGEYYHFTSAQHTDLTDGGDTSLHKHDDRYYTESELGDTTDTTEGASLIGTDAKTNLGGGTTVESALEFLDGQDPPKLSTNAGNPNAGAGIVGAIGDKIVDTTNSIPYLNVDGTNTGWVVI